MYQKAVNTLCADERRGDLLSKRPCEVAKQALMYKDEVHQCTCNLLFLAAGDAPRS